jgi:chromosome segregation ATPase
MLSSIQTALAKKFAPTSEIVKQFDTVNSESAELDRKIEEKKAKLQEAGWAAPQSVQRLAGELNALEAQRKSNETAVAALQSGLEASKAAERAAERAKQRAELLRRVETDKVFMTGMYQQLAKQMLPGLKHLAETERLGVRV